MHIAGQEEEHIFTVRLWRERSAAGPNDQEWRGRLRHSSSKSSRHFVGLNMLFELIRDILRSVNRSTPPTNKAS